MEPAMRTLQVNRCSRILVGVAAILCVSSVAETQISSALRAPTLLRACGAAAKTVTFNLLAQLGAPVYWFSPDEPLITSSNRDIAAVDIPARLPNTRGPARIVYYRVSNLRVRDHVTPDVQESFARGPGVNNMRVAFGQVAHVHIRYLAYYPKDIGVGQHPHDLEVVEVELAIEPILNEPVQCYAVRVTRVAGAAHGSDWYSNVLDVSPETDDLVLPPHILVEEGKHASAPDRNADGWFTPGYDATLNANDAWGVRDTIRENRLRSRMYAPMQAKDRCANPQIAISRQSRQGIFGVAADRRGQRANPTLTHCFFDQASARSATYALVEAGGELTAEYCSGTTVSALADDSGGGLRSLLEKWKFCGRTTVKRERGAGSWIADNLLAGPEGPGDATRRDRFTMAGRWSGGNGWDGLRMVSIVPGFGIRAGMLGGGWFVPRFSVGVESCRRSWDVLAWVKSCGGSLDVLYTPSGSRIVDWYFAFGRDWWPEPGGSGVVEEMGLKLRFPSWKFSVINSLGSVRFGYRGALHQGVGGGRFVLELGLGGW